MLARRLARLEQEQERLLAGLAQGDRRFRRLARSVWRVQEEERRRLAHELHDGLGQTLTALRLRIERLRLEIEPQVPGAAATLAEAVEIAGSALAEARELSRLLRPPVLDELGLEAALRWLARRFGGAGLEVEARLAGLESKLPAELEMTVFRLVQESLNNVAKHAGVARAGLEVALRDERLRLVVVDAGRGFTPGAAPAGVGMRSMQERVAAFGGRFELRSEPGAGTRIEIDLPLYDRLAEEM